MTAYLRPTTIDEAVAARAEHPDYMVLAGGTDLLVSAVRKPTPPGIIDVFGLEPLSQIATAPDGTITIGAATPYSAIIASTVVCDELPMLRDCCREIGALQIQARGTIGGNIGTSSPVGDTLPVLLALDAQIELASSSGRRMVPYDTFCIGYRKTDLRNNELIVSVVFPPRPAGLYQYWRKVGTRRAQSISKAMIGACATLANGRVAHVRVGLGAVADRPVRAIIVEDAIRGRPPGTELAAIARAAGREDMSPISDVRSTSRYRQRVTQNLLARFVLSLAGRNQDNR